MDRENLDQKMTEIENVARTNPALWRSAWRQMRLVWRLLWDRDVPIYVKFIPAAAIVYLFMPMDFIPDLIPVLGQLDDIGLLLVGAKAFVEFSPNQIVERHLRQIDIEDGTYMISDDKLNKTIVIDVKPD